MLKIFATGIKALLAAGVLSFVMGAQLASAQVATVFEITGSATASAAVAPGSPAAASRALRQGDGINQGESVTTGAASTIVLRFLDGQVVALAASSTFTVTAYTYNKANPAQSNVLLSLVNGGMRALTGLIGKARPQAVAYRAGNATIGIRGTDVVLVINNQRLVISVIDGNVSFTVGNQTVNIGKQQGARVDLSNPNAPVVVLPSTALTAALKAAPDGTVLDRVLSSLATAERSASMARAFFGATSQTSSTPGATDTQGATVTSTSTSQGGNTTSIGGGSVSPR